MKEVYNKVKGDMTNKPNDGNNDLFVIKIPSNKNINDVLKKVKSTGAMTPKKSNESDSKTTDDEPYTSLQFVKVKGDGKDKPGSQDEPIQYIKLSGPLLNKPVKGNEPEQYYKVKVDGDVNDVLYKLKTLGSNWNKPENDPSNKDKYVKLSGNELNNVKDYFKGNEKGGDGEGPEEYYYRSKVLGDSKNKDANQGKNGGKIKSVTVKGDPDNNLNKSKKVGDLFKNKKKDTENPIYYYTKL